jgi:hypothetical protein
MLGRVNPFTTRDTGVRPIAVSIVEFKSTQLPFFHISHNKIFTFSRSGRLFRVNNEQIPAVEVYCRTFITSD